MLRASMVDATSATLSPGEHVITALVMREWKPAAGGQRASATAEEKIRIVLDGLRGEHSIAELCRREGIA